MKTILVDAIDTFVIEGEGIFKPLYDLLNSYPNRKIIVTNANEAERKQFELDKMPYEVFSLDHNPNKTNPIYFERLLHKFKLKAEDVVYFEHSIDAIKSAQNLMIKSYHYDHINRDLDALKAFLEKNL